MVDSLLILSLMALMAASLTNPSRILLWAWATEVISSDESKSLTIRDM
jgi:hypothetical protein